jgi:hypothetical protein
LFTGRWTFYPSKVYLALNTISVIRHGTTAKIFSNYILTLNPSELFTQVLGCYGAGKGCTRTVRPFNFADLQPTVPASAYFGRVEFSRDQYETEKPQALFNGRAHDTIVEGNYWPTIALPAAISSIDPELFRTCKVATTWEKNGEWLDHGIFDPPVVLSPLAATTLLAPTLPFQASSVGQMQGEMRPTLNLPLETAAVAQQPEFLNGFDVPNFASQTPLPVAATVTSKSTMTALPMSLLVQIGNQALQAGKAPLDLGDVIISRGPDGKFVVESPEARGTGRAGQTTPTKVDSKSTLTYLPDSLLSRVGSQALQAGGLTMGATVISRAPDGNFIVESAEVSSMAPTKITSKATFSALPESLLGRIGSQTLQPGGQAVTIDDTIISRDGNGNFVIETSETYRSATNTARKKSGEPRTASTSTRLSCIFFTLLLGALLLT